jgi:uncharacterized protein (DUF58 family)
MREEILRRLTRRPLPITPKRPATSQLSGEWPSPYSGKGLDFRSHRPYQLGDDLRTVHMGTSVRTGQDMVVDRIALRDISLLVVLDCTASMGVRNKADILLACALMMLYSGVSMEMRVGAAVLGANGYRRLGIGSGQRHALRLFDAIERICGQMRQGSVPEIDFPATDAHRLLPGGGVLLYLSDFLDERGYARDYESYAVEARRYDFVPVVIQDEFEYTFPDLADESMMDFSSPETGAILPLWLGQREKTRIRQLHEQRFVQLQTSFASHGLRHVHVETPSIDLIQQTLTRFFVLR